MLLYINKQTQRKNSPSIQKIQNQQSLICPAFRYFSGVKGRVFVFSFAEEGEMINVKQTLSASCGEIWTENANAGVHSTELPSVEEDR